jgi:hypothetical protein
LFIQVLGKIISHKDLETLYSIMATIMKDNLKMVKQKEKEDIF